MNLLNPPSPRTKFLGMPLIAANSNNGHVVTHLSALLILKKGDSYQHIMPYGAVLFLTTLHTITRNGLSTAELRDGFLARSRAWRKATVSLVTPVCPRGNNWAPTARIFVKFHISGFFRQKSVKKIQVRLKS